MHTVLELLRYQDAVTQVFVVIKKHKDVVGRRLEMAEVNAVANTIRLACLPPLQKSMMRCWYWNARGWELLTATTRLS